MKRNNENFKSNSSKKLKLDNDDLWEDDIDEINLLMTTQACEDAIRNREFNDISILPTYNGFKNNDILCSTMAGPSYNDINDRKKINTLEEKLSKLQAHCLVKDGEVAILRSQLKTTKESMDNELTKNIQTYEEKLEIRNREIKKFSTELEFKDLEIANLKRKLAVQNKITVDATLSLSQVVKETKRDVSPKTKELDDVVSYIEAISVAEYPLQTVIPSSFFNKPVAGCGLLKSITTCGRKETFHNMLNITNNVTIPSHMTRNHKITFEYIFPEISFLITAEKHVLDSKSITGCINKIISLALYFMENFYNYLKNEEEFLSKETISQLDLDLVDVKNTKIEFSFSLFESTPLYPKECGIQCRQSIAILAALLPFNTYLRNYILENQLLENLETEELKNLNQHIDTNDISFFKLVLSIVEIIGRMEITPFCHGFLYSVCIFFGGLCDTSTVLSQNIYNLLKNITREIVLSRPNLLVLSYLTKFLKKISLHKEFVEILCNMPTKEAIEQSNKKGIVLITQDCCTFQVFSLLYRQNIREFNINYYERDLNILKFLLNVCNSNASWLYYQEQQHYDCLFEFNKLSVEVIYSMLNNFNKEIEDEKYNDFYKNILQLSIIILHILNFKSYQFIERDPNVYAKYKIIKRKLLQIKNYIDFREFYVDALQQLCENSLDDSVNTELDKLNGISFWSGK